MNSEVLRTVVAKPPPVTGFLGALFAALQRITWKAVGVTVAIAVILELWVGFTMAFDAPKIPLTAEAWASAALVNIAMAFTVMLTTLVADENVARGAIPRRAYVLAVIIGCALGALAQWGLHAWLGVRNQFYLRGAADDVAVMQPVSTFFEYLIWGSIIVFMYVNRRTELASAARMNAAQIERAETRRRTLESRLQALQARVEPQFLFSALAQTRDLYDESPERGSRMLDDLIVYLRAALPHLRDSTSTLAQELTLLKAYAGILRGGEPLVFEVEAAAPTLDARVPAMVLLPLLAHVLGSSLLTPSDEGTFIRFGARVAGDVLRIELAWPSSQSGADSDDVLCDIRERLVTLYGERTLLAVVAAEDSASRLVLEIPYGSADGSHR